VKTEKQTPEMTKMTARLFAPMYADFDRQMTNTFIRRDAFLDQVLANEVPRIKANLAGKRLSQAAHRYVAGELKRLSLGRKDSPPLKQVSIQVRHSTVEALRQVVEEHNLVRDAVINRLIAFLRSSDGLLDSLGLPKRVTANRRNGTDDMPTSPLRAIEETQWDPFYYLRASCETVHGCGMWDLPLPKQIHGLTCYMADEDVPGTPENILAGKSYEDMLSDFAIFESSLTPINGVGNARHD